MAVLVAALIWRAGAEVIESRGAPVPGARQHMHVVWGVAIVTLLAMSLPAAIGAAGPALRALDALLDWSFDVGGQKISIGRVLVALLWIFAAWALSRVINFTLTQRILPHASVDAGVRQAITATVGYLLIAVGVLFAIRALGYDLTSLAIVAGALSVGVGFGMQNLVSNFVSGLIILYERPFRPGDILDVDGTMGTVKKIQTRSTIVQTFDESDLVLPNSELLAKPITNWTLTNYLARAVVTVGVAYGSNVELVRELLHDAAAAHPRVIDEPKIYFHAFGDSALEFRLMVWVDVREKLQVLSDLHFAIDRVFREKGISIPFPQRELRVHAVGE
jgi:small-conductance mechanosensitive channel